MIWPRDRRVDVWSPIYDPSPPRGVENTLDGEDVVPGFTYLVARLFP